MPRPALLLTAAAVVTVGCVGLGTALSEPSYDEPSLPPVVSLADFAVSDVTVPRTDLCGRIDDGLVERALGGPVTTTRHYGDGETAQVTDEVEDVVHELGCDYEGEDGTRARTWVFAPPVAAPRAAALVAGLREEPGCAPIEDAPALGTPSVALRCDGEVPTVSFHGLLGDAWLACSLASPTAPAGALLERAGRWCVDVLRSVAE